VALQIALVFKGTYFLSGSSTSGKRDMAGLNKDKNLTPVPEFSFGIFLKR